MAMHALSPIVYLDTSIYSELVKKNGVWDAALEKAINRMLHARGAAIGISMYNIFELHHATRKHSALFEITRRFPIVLLRPPGHILRDEITSYPKIWQGDLQWLNLSHPAWAILPAPMRVLLLNKFTEKISAELKRQAKLAPSLYAASHEESCNFLKSQNLIPEDTDPTITSIAPNMPAFFANLQTYQRIRRDYPAFKDRDTSSIRSLQMSAHLEYWKFYHERKAPNQEGDHTDQLHSIYFPYCSVVVIENHGAAVLRKIKHHSSLLETVDILTLKDLRKEYGSPR